MLAGCLGIIVTHLIQTAYRLVSSKMIGLPCLLQRANSCTKEAQAGLKQFLTPDPGKEVRESEIQWASDKI